MSIKMVMEDFKSTATSKKAQILVQITGALRNLANIDASHEQMADGAIENLCNVFFDPMFAQGKELMLNIARLLSRVSLNMKCSEMMVKSNHVKDFLAAMVTHKHSSAILIRLAYILGSLTTNFEEARRAICVSDNNNSSFEALLHLGTFYLKEMKTGEGLKTPAPQGSDKKPVKKGSKQLPSKYEEFTQGNLEDAVTKIIKLFANMATEEVVAAAEFTKHKETLGEFVSELSIAVSKSSLEQNEEFILNAVSCITNILYYDTA